MFSTFLITFVTIIGGGLAIDQILGREKRVLFGQTMWDSGAKFGIAHSFAYFFDTFFFGSFFQTIKKALLFSFASFAFVAIVTFASAPPSTEIMSQTWSLWWKFPLLGFIALNAPVDLVNIVKTKWVLYWLSEREGFLACVVVVLVSAALCFGLVFGISGSKSVFSCLQTLIANFMAHFFCLQKKHRKYQSGIVNLCSRGAGSLSQLISRCSCSAVYCLKCS